jgi:hypothetical protein
MSGRFAVAAALLAAAAGHSTTPTIDPVDASVSTLHVSTAAAAPAGAAPPAAADGSAAHPYGSLQAAKDHIIRQHAARGGAGIRRVRIGAGLYAPVAIDHAALSGVEWRGAGRNLTAISGGIEVPRQRFKPWPGLAVGRRVILKRRFLYICAQRSLRS